jgi:hypothetical protein
MLFCFKTRIITINPPTPYPPKINKSWGVCGWQKNWIGKGYRSRKALGTGKS